MVPARETAEFRGTSSYASTNAHNQKASLNPLPPLSPRTDPWAGARGVRRCTIWRLGRGVPTTPPGCASGCTCDPPPPQPQDLGRRDVLWSLFYVMIEFLEGDLPWRVAEKDKVCELKEYHMKHPEVRNPKP